MIAPLLAGPNRQSSEARQDISPSWLIRPDYDHGRIMSVIIIRCDDDDEIFHFPFFC